MSHQKYKFYTVQKTIPFCEIKDLTTKNKGVFKKLTEVQKL